MTTALIIVEGEIEAFQPQITALQQAAIAHSPEPIAVAVCSTTTLGEKVASSEIYCPLTLNLPANFEFPGRWVYQACQDVTGTRQWVEEKLDYRTGEGRQWLPIVLTAKGPLYGEAIAQQQSSYQQPLHLTDDLRQPLYHLAYQLLDNLNAPPAVYLLQFSQHGPEIIFDRLFPFPAPPAIASLNVQHPDLFTCHWLCLTHQPILDLLVV